MEPLEKETFRRCLRTGELTNKYLKEILTVFKPPLKAASLDELGFKTSSYLKGLEFYLITGTKSWQGLAVGFPGDTRDLTTSNVGTPFLRLLLYPICELFERVNEEYFKGQARCCYFMGVRFPEVFIRKFKLISPPIPRLIILTQDLVKTLRHDLPDPLRRQDETKESYLQGKLCQLMYESGLVIPDTQKSFETKLLSYEVKTAEGTENPERLDILGYDTQDGSLVAFEIKGECKEDEFNNLFTQGMEHRNWLEENKMAVKLVAEGPRGRKIKTRKRVKLVLGACQNKAPDLFRRFKAAKAKDKYLQISFVRIVKENHTVRLEPL